MISPRDAESFAPRSLRFHLPQEMVERDEGETGERATALQATRRGAFDVVSSKSLSSFRLQCQVHVHDRLECSIAIAAQNPPHRPQLTFVSHG